jgi:cytochrome P450
MSVPTVSINFYAPEVIADPWPYFQQVRAAGPVVFNDVLTLWHVHRYRDVIACFSDTDHFSSTVHKRTAPWLKDSMITVDPPEHHRLRNPMQSSFTKRELNRWESRITGLIDDLFARFVAKVSAGDDVDLVDDFVWHVPSVVIAEMMGIPHESRDDFHRWSIDLVTGVGSPLDRTEFGQQKRTRAEEANVLIHDFLGEEIARRKTHPTDDLLGQAIAANENGAMSDEELIETAVLLLVAGNDTTAKLLAHSVVKLYEFPDQRALVVDDPSLIPAAVEEVLRFEQLSQSIPRLVHNGPVTVSGQKIPDDEIVWLMAGMANRDPEVFENPDVIDVTRTRPAPHLGFGYGAHLCLGANLARMEVRIGLERILGRYPDYEVRSFELSKGWSVRGPLHIDFVPQPSPSPV